MTQIIKKGLVRNLTKVNLFEGTSRVSEIATILKPSVDGPLRTLMTKIEPKRCGKSLTMNAHHANKKKKISHDSSLYRCSRKPSVRLYKAKHSAMSIRSGCRVGVGSASSHMLLKPNVLKKQLARYIHMRKLNLHPALKDSENNVSSIMRKELMPVDSELRSRMAVWNTTPAKTAQNNIKEVSESSKSPVSSSGPVGLTHAAQIKPYQWGSKVTKAGLKSSSTAGGQVGRNGPKFKYGQVQSNQWGHKSVKPVSKSFSKVRVEQKKEDRNGKVGVASIRKLSDSTKAENDYTKTFAKRYRGPTINKKMPYVPKASAEKSRVPHFPTARAVVSLPSIVGKTESPANKVGMASINKLTTREGPNEGYFHTFKQRYETMPVTPLIKKTPVERPHSARMTKDVSAAPENDSKLEPDIVLADPPIVDAALNDNYTLLPKEWWPQNAASRVENLRTEERRRRFRANKEMLQNLSYEKSFTDEQHEFVSTDSNYRETTDAMADEIKCNTTEDDDDDESDSEDAPNLYHEVEAKFTKTKVTGGAVDDIFSPRISNEEFIPVSPKYTESKASAAKANMVAHNIFLSRAANGELSPVTLQTPIDEPNDTEATVTETVPIFRSTSHSNERLVRNISSKMRFTGRKPTEMTVESGSEPKFIPARMLKTKFAESNAAETITSGSRPNYVLSSLSNENLEIVTSKTQTKATEANDTVSSPKFMRFSEKFAPKKKLTESMATDAKVTKVTVPNIYPPIRSNEKFAQVASKTKLTESKAAGTKTTRVPASNIFSSNRSNEKIAPSVSKTKLTTDKSTEAKPTRVGGPKFLTARPFGEKFGTIKSQTKLTEIKGSEAKATRTPVPKIVTPVRTSHEKLSFATARVMVNTAAKGGETKVNGANILKNTSSSVRFAPNVKSKTTTARSGPGPVVSGVNTEKPGDKDMSARKLQNRDKAAPTGKSTPPASNTRNTPSNMRKRYSLLIEKND